MRYSPDVADFNLASFLLPGHSGHKSRLHWLTSFPFYWSPRPPTSSKPDWCLLLSIAGLIAPTPTSMSGWVSEWAAFLLHLSHLLRSDGCDPDQQSWWGSLHLFCFLQGGWCTIWEHGGRRDGSMWSAATPRNGDGPRGEADIGSE